VSQFFIVAGPFRAGSEHPHSITVDWQNCEQFAQFETNHRDPSHKPSDAGRFELLALALSVRSVRVEFQRSTQPGRDVPFLFEQSAGRKNFLRAKCLVMLIFRVILNFARTALGLALWHVRQRFIPECHHQGLHGCAQRCACQH
jgi:hypothetical protein